MNVHEFIKKYDEPGFFKALSKLGAKFSVDELFVKCEHGGSVVGKLGLIINDFADDGIITLNCSNGKEHKFSLKELFSVFKGGGYNSNVCSTCNKELLTFSVIVKGLTISYIKIHNLFEHPERVENDEVINKLISFLS